MYPVILHPTLKSTIASDMKSMAYRSIYDLAAISNGYDRNSVPFLGFAPVCFATAGVGGRVAFIISVCATK